MDLNHSLERAQAQVIMYPMPDPPSEDFATRTNRLHPDEVDIDVALVRRLVAAQFPEIGDVTIQRVRSTGTVNAIYRLGDHLYARLPRRAEWEADLDSEWTWLPKLAPHLTLRIPSPVAKGDPGPGYPFSWAVYEWMDGEPYTDELIDDEDQAARDLARFVTELGGVEPVEGIPRAGRRPLVELDEATREAIELAQGVIDSHAAIVAWERALETQPWQGTPVWIGSGERTALHDEDRQRHGRSRRTRCCAASGRLVDVSDVGVLDCVAASGGERRSSPNRPRAF